MPLFAAVIIVAMPIFAIGDAHKKGALELDTFPPKVHAEKLFIQAEYPQ